MRIAYLGQMADVSCENGISKKIVGQARRWLEAGHAVRYFSLVPNPKTWSGLAPMEVELVTRGGALRRMLRSLELARRIRAWRPDVIYFRYAHHSPGLPELFRDIPTVAEINSDDLAEYPLTLSAPKLAYHRFTRNEVLRAVAAFVPVTYELRDRFARFGKPAEVIANGIALDTFTPAPLPGPDVPLRLVFIGSRNTPWHGLERVVELASLFPEFFVDVIGADPIAGPSNLHFHGELPRAEYEPILQSSTTAIGTMGRHLTAMEEGCPLKVREYLALGLPVIAAYRDTDVPSDAEYFLRLPNDVSPLAPHRTRIAAWLERWRHRRVPRAAIAHLDNAVKEGRRLDFLLRFARQP